MDVFPRRSEQAQIPPSSPPPMSGQVQAMARGTFSNTNDMTCILYQRTLADAAHLACYRTVVDVVARVPDQRIQTPVLSHLFDPSDMQHTTLSRPRETAHMTPGQTPEDALFDALTHAMREKSARQQDVLDCAKRGWSLAVPDIGGSLICWLYLPACENAYPWLTLRVKGGQFTLTFDHKLTAEWVVQTADNAPCENATLFPPNSCHKTQLDRLEQSGTYAAASRVPIESTLMRNGIGPSHSKALAVAFSYVLERGLMMQNVGFPHRDAFIERVQNGLRAISGPSRNLASALTSTTPAPAFGVYTQHLSRMRATLHRHVPNPPLDVRRQTGYLPLINLNSALSLASQRAQI